MATTAGPGRSPDNHAMAALQPVVAALQCGQNHEAVRVLMRLPPSGLVPNDGRMALWLAHTLGRPLLIKLTNAFIQFPCFYCNEGRVRCEHCHGRARDEEVNRPCERCLGMGHIRCDFCGGSGWVTMSYVPEGLQRLVIKGRAALAAARTESLLRQQLPDPSASDFLPVIKRLHSCLLELDRQMGVFENTLIAARQLPLADTAGEDSLGRTIQRCVLLASQAEVRICDLIRSIAAAYRLGSRLAGAGPASRDLETAAEFYESLVDPERTMTGTGLEHPLLHEAVRQLPAGQVSRVTGPGRSGTGR